VRHVGNEFVQGHDGFELLVVYGLCGLYLNCSEKLKACARMLMSGMKSSYSS
jgi:hypothetical protein